MNKRKRVNIYSSKKKKRTNNKKQRKRGKPKKILKKDGGTLSQKVKCIKRVASANKGFVSCGWLKCWLGRAKGTVCLQSGKTNAFGLIRNNNSLITFNCESMNIWYIEAKLVTNSHPNKVFLNSYRRIFKIYFFASL